MQLPEAFIRNTKATVNVKFKLFGGNLTEPLQIEVRGWGTDSINFPAYTADLGDDGFYHYTAEATQAFLDEVHHYDDFEIDWEVKLPGGAWQAAGTSKNDLYLVLDEPVGGNALHHTFVHIGSHYGAGSTNADSLINSVWSHFQGLSVKRQDETTHIGGTTIPDVGNPFEYWKDYHNQGPILTHGCGSCGDFTGLFLDILHVQGFHEDNNVVRISDLILVNNWTALGPQIATNSGLVDIIVWDFVGDLDTDGDGIADIRPELDANGTGYAFGEHSQLGDGQGLPGQNSRNPRGHFNGHTWVKITVAGQSRWLDPSYGVEYVGANEADKANDFEDTSLYGFQVDDVVDLELAMGLDLDYDGEVTADAGLDDDIYFMAVRRQQPGVVEVHHSFDTYNGNTQ